MAHRQRKRGTKTEKEEHTDREKRTQRKRDTKAEKEWHTDRERKTDIEERMAHRQRKKVR